MIHQRLDGKRALAFAAAHGIGRAPAVAMPDTGAQLFATDVNAEALADLTHPDIESFVMDMRVGGSSVKDAVAVEQFVSRQPMGRVARWMKLPRWWFTWSATSARLRRDSRISSTVVGLVEVRI